MWKTAVWSYFSTLFYQQGQCGKPALFHKDGKKENSQKFLHRNSIHNPQRLWKTLQTGVDICVDITDVILQVLIAGGQHLLHLIDGVDYRGVILVQFLADVGGGQIGQLPDQVDGHLTSLGCALVL